jgi:hypothetical protein
MMLRMTAAGFLGVHPDFRGGTPEENPRALKLNAETGGTELWPVEIVPERWHRLYVTVDARDGTVWEIQRLAGGGEYRVLHDQVEPTRRAHCWAVARAQLCALAASLIYPDPDEPQVRVGDLAYVVTHGLTTCEVGKGVVAGEEEALSYAAGVFEMNRKGRADHEFRRRLGR